MISNNIGPTTTHLQRFSYKKVNYQVILSSDSEENNDLIMNYHFGVSILQFVLLQNDIFCTSYDK